jgi:two-component system cell cycle sensor histidine kinase/response regulator CckA
MSSNGCAISNHNGVSQLRFIRVLLLEDTPDDAELSLRQLMRGGFQVEADVVRTPDEFKARLSSRTYDIILGDYRLPGWTGIEAVHWLRAEGYDLPFILVSGTLADDLAVESIKLGVTDYVSKDRLERLSAVVHRALREEELRRHHSGTQQELRESEKQYRLLFEINPHPMWVFGAQSFEIIEVNGAALLHYGYSRSEFLSMTILDIGPAEDIPATRQSVRARVPGRAQAERCKHRKRDGTLIDVEITSHELSFYGKQAILAQAHDITERLQNEENLRQSEERFSKAFRSSPVAITISTRAEGRYVDANEAFLRMLGRRWEEVVGFTANELNVWAFPEDRDKMVLALDRDGRLNALETVFNSKTGGERKVRLSAERIQLNGVPCVLAITSDVTEAKRLEDQFRQAQKMEAVGRLAGGVAHDFNNMLSVILGFCDLAQYRTNQEGTERELNHIKRAAQRAATLTRQLLAFSRQQLLLPRVVNLNDVVHDITPMLLRVLAKDVSLTFVPVPSLGSVRVDLGQMEQVLMNLVVNASDAMPHGGKLFIETANTELDQAYSKTHPAVEPGHYVALSVSDTGCGMDPKTLSRIFEPFYTTKPVGEGTGLGLSMVDGVIHQSGGHICVYSEPDRGTTFTVYLPRIEEAAEPLPRVTVELPPEKGTETVLVVEDEQDLRELIVELIESEGYRGLMAENGRSAIAISETYREMIHMLLTDVALPDMSGTVLSTRIKESRPDLKVLYMSGYTGNLIAHHGTLTSSSAFIQKPFTKQGLLTELRRVLKK